MQFSIKKKAFIDRVRNFDALKEDAVRNNICKECNIHMDIKRDTDEMQCPKCGIIEVMYESCHDGKIQSVTRVCTSSGKVSYQQNEPYDVQRKEIIKLLEAKNAEYIGAKLPKYVMNEVAERYSNIQRKYAAMAAENDKVKFVRRGESKNAILAQLIYEVTNEKKIPRAQSEIAQLMGIRVNGFSKGLTCLRDLELMGVYQMTKIQDPREDYVERYLESFKMTNDKYKQFVLDLLKASEDACICVNSSIINRIIACIVLIIRGVGLNITNDDIEKTPGACRKNTYEKFCTEIANHKELFTGVFDKHEIPFKPKQTRK